MRIWITQCIMGICRLGAWIFKRNKKIQCIAFAGFFRTRIRAVYVVHYNHTYEYVCARVCLCERMCFCNGMRMYVRICVVICEFVRRVICTHVFVCMCAIIRECGYFCVCVWGMCLWLFVRECVYKYECACMCVDMCMYVCVCRLHAPKDIQY